MFGVKTARRGEDQPFQLFGKRPEPRGGFYINQRMREKNLPHAGSEHRLSLADLRASNALCAMAQLHTQNFHAFMGLNMRPERDARSFARRLHGNDVPFKGIRIYQYRGRGYVVYGHKMITDEKEFRGWPGS